MKSMRSLVSAFFLLRWTVASYLNVRTYDGRAGVLRPCGRFLAPYVPILPRWKHRLEAILSVHAIERVYLTEPVIYSSSSGSAKPASEASEFAPGNCRSKRRSNETDDNGLVEARTTPPLLPLLLLLQRSVIAVTVLFSSARSFSLESSFLSLALPSLTLRPSLVVTRCSLHSGSPVIRIPNPSLGLTEAGLKTDCNLLLRPLRSRRQRLRETLSADRNNFLLKSDLIKYSSENFPTISSPSHSLAEELWLEALMT